MKLFSEQRKQIEIESPVKMPWKRWDIIMASMGLNILALVLPLTILQFYDRVIPNHSYSTLAMFSLGLGLAILMEIILLTTRATILTWLGVAFEYTLSVSGFKHLLHAQITDANRKGIGEHIHDLESVSVLREFMAGQGFLSLIDIPFIFLCFALIYYFIGYLVWIPIIITLIFIGAAIYAGRQFRKIIKERKDVDDRRYSYLIEVFSNYHTLKSMAMEEQILRRFERIHKQGSKIDYMVNQSSHEARELGALFSYIMFVGLVGFIAQDVISYKISIGAMAACIVLSNRIIQPIQTLLGLWTRYQLFHIAKQRYEGLKNLALESDRSKINNDQVQGHIRFDDVCFHYPESDHLILNRVNMSVKAGQIVTIWGVNGAGKTTLARLIMGHLKPDAGKILIDNHPHGDYSLKMLRHNMIYLEPQGVLFQGTIMQNITMFRTGSAIESAKQAACQLDLDPWVNHLPKGYETQIGDSLFNLLPAGIQQRICLARALVIAPKILILDEANTAFDLKGDEYLLKTLTLLKGNTTVVIVTHRPSMDRIADASFELVDGHIKPREIIQTQGSLS